MSKKQWAFRIRHIRESVDEIMTYAHGHDFESFSNTPVLQRAVERCLEIIGEASSGVPDEIKQNYPSIPWNKLKGMRNFLAHQYDEVLEKVLWDTISQDIPKLQEQLSVIIIEREKDDQ